MQRADGRDATSLRELQIQAAVNPFADGSAEVLLGDTRLLIAAKLKEEGSGQVLVSLSMMPLATRLSLIDASKELASEIELIEKICSETLSSSLQSAAVDSIDVHLFVSVCVADGGVVAATVAGGWVALYEVLSEATESGLLSQDLNLPRVASLSAGIIDATPCLDLLSEETAQTSFNAVVCASVQGSILSVHAQRGSAAAASEQSSSDTIKQLSDLCLDAMQEIFRIQAEAVA